MKLTDVELLDLERQGTRHAQEFIIASNAMIQHAGLLASGDEEGLIALFAGYFRTLYADMPGVDRDSAMRSTFESHAIGPRLRRDELLARIIARMDRGRAAG